MYWCIVNSNLILKVLSFNFPVYLTWNRLQTSGFIRIVKQLGWSSRVSGLKLMEVRRHLTCIINKKYLLYKMRKTFCSATMCYQCVPGCPRIMRKSPFLPNYSGAPFMTINSSTYFGTSVISIKSVQQLDVKFDKSALVSETAVDAALCISFPINLGISKTH